MQYECGSNPVPEGRLAVQATPTAAAAAAGQVRLGLHGARKVVVVIRTHCRHQETQASHRRRKLLANDLTVRDATLALNK